jgi:hypothetical protein
MEKYILAAKPLKNVNLSKHYGKVSKTMKNTEIRLKHKYKTNFKTTKYSYLIQSSSNCIGEISFKKKNCILIIAFIEIYPSYRNQHYGYQVVEYLLSHYKVHCIIGEALSVSTGFWQKCIHKYGGQRKNIVFHDNCSSSFVIPRYQISSDEIYQILEETDSMIV